MFLLSVFCYANIGLSRLVHSILIWLKVYSPMLIFAAILGCIDDINILYRIIYSSVKQTFKCKIFQALLLRYFVFYGMTYWQAYKVRSDYTYKIIIIVTCAYSEIIHGYYELLRGRHALRYRYNTVKTVFKSVRIIKNSNASCDLGAFRPFRPTIVLLRRCFGTYIGIDVTFASTLYKPFRVYFTIRALSVQYFAGPRTVHDTRATYTARREPRLDDVGGSCVTYTHTLAGAFVAYRRGSVTAVIARHRRTERDKLVVVDDA